MNIEDGRSRTPQVPAKAAGKKVNDKVDNVNVRKSKRLIKLEK